MAGAAVMERPATTGASVTIEAVALAKAMKFAASIVQSAQAIPILANVRLEAADGSDAIEIVTTDMDREIRQVVPLSSPAEGALAITVNAGRLAAISGAADHGAQMQLTLGDSRLAVKAGRSRFQLPTLATRNFPDIPIETLNKPAVFSKASELASAIERVDWSASPEVTQHWLHGVYLNNEAGKVRLTAAHKAGMAMITMGTAFPFEAPDVIVPLKVTKTLILLCADRTEPLHLSWDDKKIRAEVGPVTFTGKLAEATFPDYRRLLPDFNRKVVIDAEPTLKAIRRVQLISDGKTREIKIERKASHLVFSAMVPDCGDSEEEVPADCTEGFAAGFNGALFARMITAIGGDTIEIHQDDPNSPACVRRVVDDGSFALLMPMKI